MKPVVPIIKISGIIDREQYITKGFINFRTKQVEFALKQINPNISKALAVVVNSPGI
jgi:hypothetical protein